MEPTRSATRSVATPGRPRVSATVAREYRQQAGGSRRRLTPDRRRRQTELAAPASVAASVRAATLHDLPGTYRVCLMTGDSGRDGTALFRNPDLLGHVYVGPCVVGQPDLALVVADAGGVAGYCLAASDSRAFEAWAEAEWWPPLREE